MNILEREHGVNTDTLSVDKKHYDDFLSIMYDNRLVGPKVDILIEELGELRTVQRGQKVVIDHPRKGSKDLSDATCGAIFNAITYTPKPVDEVVEVLSYSDLHKRDEPKPEPLGVIKAPKRDMPDELQDYLINLRLI
jgi:hypothetical protein